MYELTTLFTHWHPFPGGGPRRGVTRRAMRARRLEARSLSVLRNGPIRSATGKRDRERESGTERDGNDGSVARTTTRHELPAALCHSHRTTEGYRTGDPRNAAAKRIRETRRMPRALFVVAIKSETAGRTAHGATHGRARPARNVTPATGIRGATDHGVRKRAETALTTI